MDALPGPRLAAEDRDAILGDHLPAEAEGGSREEIQGETGVQAEAGRVDPEPVLVPEVKRGLHGGRREEAVGAALVVVGLELLPAIHVRDADPKAVGVADIPGEPCRGLARGDPKEPAAVGERDVAEVLRLAGPVGVDPGHPLCAPADALVPELEVEVAALHGIQLHGQRPRRIEVHVGGIPVHVRLLVRGRRMHPAPDLSGEIDGGRLGPVIVGLLADLELPRGPGRAGAVRGIPAGGRAVPKPCEERIGAPGRRRHDIQGGVGHRRDGDVCTGQVEAPRRRRFTAGGQEERGPREERGGPSGEGKGHGLTWRR